MIAAPQSVHFLGAKIADSRRRLLRHATARAPVSAVHTTPSERGSPARAASLYDTLGVSLTATSQEIKAAYRRLARTSHPDAGASAEDFMRIHDAYSTLSDPGKRADYDRRVSAPILQQRGPTRPVSPFTGRFSPRRTWETDQCW